MAGCGGFCGNTDSFPVTQFTNNLNWGLVCGYASGTTDSGHSSFVVNPETGELENKGRTYAAWAEDNRRGEIDWGYRSIHEVTRVSKAIICLFYGRPAKYSYFAGCSTGGRQAIMEALRYPLDFDGVISGAPALEYTSLVATWMSWIAQAMNGVSFTAAELAAVEQAVLSQCDGLDGATDGLISDPRRCPEINFSGAGLIPGQVAALNQLYSKPVNTLGAKLYESLIPYGSEIYWPLWVPNVAVDEIPYAFGLIGPFNENFLKYMAFQKDNPEFTANEFNLDAHPALLEFMGKIYNATSTNLEKFKSVGGKIVMYHGWADSIVPPIYTINYYERVVASIGGLGKTQDFFRLFMVPGMDHCSSLRIIGYDDFDALGALENWVEKGIAPKEIFASGNTLDDPPQVRSRPLYPYPLYAKFLGGDPNDPDNFAAENDGSVRWDRFRDDTFYSIYLPGIGDENDPLSESEGLGYFQPYDYRDDEGEPLEDGKYIWRVWSPSMFQGVDYPGYNGVFFVEPPF